VEQQAPTPITQACPDCHALVTDLVAHMSWHTRLVADLSMAVEREILRRSAAD